MLPQTEPSLTTLRERYLDAQLAGNRKEAPRLLVDEGLLRGVPLQVLPLEIIRRDARELVASACRALGV
ncbi:hypothetical protein [Myxococcus sp. RHSTA-1-4]|uniref:hypothetical protein n=1 Tax=Myxococcus sp. RHSTA-1-4 TaxID=2874601 RepID=UPI001CBB68EE|nr:hypothetical protein [Myxococcus sp. RHSTA-1-4]